MDPVNQKQHRFNHIAYSIIGMMDGSKTLEELWNHCNISYGDDALTQDELIGLIGALHRAELLQSNMEPDILQMFERRKKTRKQKLQQKLNPFSIRFPLIDPTPFLNRFKPAARYIFNRYIFWAWLLLVITAGLLAMTHWQELTHNISDKILSPANLALLYLCFPLVKLLHELGHAFAIKIWGGEVREMGIILLAFAPVPYVEGSASASFSDKNRRIITAAAGIMVEMTLASFALFLWLTIEPGVVRAITYNIMLIGGVSTLLFNGNPLMRFDGYYLLSDWLELPNLYKRSSLYLAYLFKRYLLGMDKVQSPVTAKGETGWLFGYGVLSFFYRLLITYSIALFIGQKFFIIGIIIAIWGLTLQIIMPAIRHIRTYTEIIANSSQQPRIFYGTLAAVIACTLILFIIPVPVTTSSQGVVTAPENSIIRAGADCFITSIDKKDGGAVSKNDQLMQCRNPLLKAQIATFAADVIEAEASYQGTPIQSRTERNIAAEKLEEAKARLEHAQKEAKNLTIESRTGGIFFQPPGPSLVGRFVHQGDIVGYILANDSPATLSVAVSEHNIDLVQQRTDKVKIRMAGSPGTILTADISREIPAASKTLPSTVLGTRAGVEIPVIPSDADGVTALTEFFLYEIRLPGGQQLYIGERGYVLFHHGYRPMIFHIFRSFRQLFLRQFNV